MRVKDKSYLKLQTAALKREEAAKLEEPQPEPARATVISALFDPIPSLPTPKSPAEPRSQKIKQVMADRSRPAEFKRKTWIEGSLVPGEKELRRAFGLDKIEKTTNKGKQKGKKTAAKRTSTGTPRTQRTRAVPDFTNLRRSERTRIATERANGHAMGEGSNVNENTSS